MNYNHKKYIMIRFFQRGVISQQSYMHSTTKQRPIIIQEDRKQRNNTQRKKKQQL